MRNTPVSMLQNKLKVELKLTLFTDKAKTE